MVDPKIDVERIKTIKANLEDAFTWSKTRVGSEFWLKVDDELDYIIKEESKQSKDVYVHLWRNGSTTTNKSPAKHCDIIAQKKITIIQGEFDD